MAFCFWRLGYARPHGLWALVSVGLVFIPLLALIISGVWQAWRGPQRLAACGWMLVGVTPLIWIAVFGMELNIKAQAREPLTLTAPVRMIAAWSCALLDLQARWKYPRWTHGRHLVQIDSGEVAEAEQLVHKMDEHLARMASLLEQPMPNVELAWVRGSLVRHDARAVLAWGLCGRDGEPAELTGLDRHEMAHTLITMLGGPDQDPPFVLVEGWAESQSADRDVQITHLADMYEAKRTYTLEELVGPAWYGTGQGPVYWEGGPLVHYLMERFEGEKFFELYTGVRQPTFHHDCERILGVSWKQMEEDFWIWVKNEARQVQEDFNAANPVVEPDPSPTKLEFAEGVNPQDWHDLVTAYRSARPGAKQSLPKDLAVLIEMDRTVTDKETGNVEQSFHSELRGDFVGDHFWVIDNSDGTEQILLLTEKEAASLRGRRGIWHGKSGGIQDAADVRSWMVNVFQSFSMIGDLDNWLRTPAEWWSKDQHVVTDLRRPAEASDEPWIVTFEWESESDPGKHRYRIELQPSLDWAVTRSMTEQVGERRSIVTYEYQRLGGQIVPRTTTAHFTGEHGKLVTRSQWRELNAQEREDLHRHVEQVARKGPTQPYHTSRQILSTAVVGIPLIGLLCLAISRLRENFNEDFEKTSVRPQ
jgi:hypothetical protein